MPGGQTGPLSDGGGSSQGGAFSANQAGPERGLEFAPQTKGGNSITPDSNHRLTEGDPRAKVQQPWFAKLPLELRKAIQARSSRRPPRGYQERLRRYSKNADR